jgi:hypothetical protein
MEIDRAGRIAEQQLLGEGLNGEELRTLRLLHREHDLRSDGV